MYGRNPLLQRKYPRLNKKRIGFGSDVQKSQTEWKEPQASKRKPQIRQKKLQIWWWKLWTVQVEDAYDWLKDTSDLVIKSLNGTGSPDWEEEACKSKRVQGLAYGPNSCNLVVLGVLWTFNNLLSTVQCLNLWTTTVSSCRTPQWLFFHPDKSFKRLRWAKIVMTSRWVVLQGKHHDHQTNLASHTLQLIIWT